MAISDVMPIVVKVTADTTDFNKQLLAAASGISIDFDPKDVIQGFASARNGVRKLIADTVSDGASAGISLARRRFKDIAQDIDNQLMSVFKLRLQGESVAAKVWTDAQKASHKEAMALEEKKLSRLEHRLGLEKKAANRIIDQRKRASKEAQRLSSRTKSEIGKDVGDSILGAFQKIRSGDVAGLLTGMGKGMAARGVGLQEKALAGGKAGGVMSQIGGLVAKIGPLIAGIGAVVAGFASLAAIIIAADSAMKGLNKDLLSSGVAGADLADQFNQIGTTLDDIRNSAVKGASFNQMWGISAKEQFEIIGAFNAAGKTIHEMSDEMDGLRKHTEAALTYSKLLGMTLGDVSSTMGSYMEELGMTLQGVSSRFSNIVAAAKESGFGVKRFFNMVLQATSGMSMYNVRLEEAAGLLLQLGDILGEKMGGDFLQSLTKGFKNESTLERTKKTMLVGTPYAAKILQKDAVASAKEFQRKLKELGEKDKGKGGIVRELLKSAGLDPDNAEKLARGVAKMSSSDLGVLQQRMIHEGGPEAAGLSRSLGGVAELGKSFQGGLGSVQAALAYAGAGATLLMKLNAVRKTVHGSLTNINTDDIKQMAAFEQNTGTSGEEARKLRLSGIGIESGYKIMKKAARGSSADRTKFNESYGKDYGVTLDEKTGKSYRVNAKGERGSEIKDLDDFFLGMGSKWLGKEKTQASEDLLLARDIARNTTDIASILGRGVEYFLSGIYDVVQIIASHLGGISAEEKKSRTEALQILQGKIRAVDAQMWGTQGEIDALNTERATASPERKAAIDKELATKSQQMKVAGVRRKSLQRQSTKMLGENSTSEFLDRDTKGWIKDAQEKAAKEDKKALREAMGEKRWESEVAGPAQRYALDTVDISNSSGIPVQEAFVKQVLGEQQQLEEDRIVEALLNPTTGQTVDLVAPLDNAASTIVKGSEDISRGASQAVIDAMVESTGRGARVPAGPGGMSGRVDPSDVTAATVSQSGGSTKPSTGAGGSTVIINSFGNSAEVVRGIQVAVAAGAI